MNKLGYWNDASGCDRNSREPIAYSDNGEIMGPTNLIDVEERHKRELEVSLHIQTS